MPASPPGINQEREGTTALCPANEAVCRRLHVRARDLQSQKARRGRSSAKKCGPVEKTSKNALTPKGGSAYKPPIETATPLATLSPPRFMRTLGLVADNLGTNACL
jgi:hypothetical protein